MRLLLELLQYAGVLLVELLLRCLSPRAALELADGAGWLWYRLDGRRRRRALASIAVARRGGLPVEDPEALALSACRSLIRVPLETLFFSRCIRNPRQMLARSRFHGDWWPFHADIAAGRGGLFVSGHLGNWEAAAWALRFLEVPYRVVVRPIENRFIDARATRTRGGAEGILPKRGAVRAMVRTLRSGGWVAIMADQNAGRRGVFVPFFGLEASTYAAPAVLAARTGLPMYAGACLRRPGRLLSFDLHLTRLPDPPRDLPDAKRAEHLLASFMRRLEDYVRLAPEQYNWVHRRWKTRPPGERPQAPLPDYAEPW